MSIKIYLSNFFLYTMPFFACVLVTLFTIYTVPVSAEIFLYSQGGNSGKDRFYYTAKPGQIIEDKVELYNTSSEDETLTISAKDIFVTDEGSFTLIAENNNNTELGSWVEISAKTISIPARQSVLIPFTITIPNTIKSGEYAGGISATIIKPNANSNVAINIRKAIRMYITVEGDLSVNAESSNLHILSPQDNNFNEYKNKFKYFGSNNMMAKFTVENTGNIFSIMKVQSQITFPNGEVKQKESVYNLAPRVGSKVFYIITNEEYKAGKTTLNIQYEVTPENNQKNEIKPNKITGSLQTSIDLSNQDLNLFASSEQKVNQTLTDLENQQQSSSIDRNQNIIIWALALGTGLFLLLATGFVYFAILKKKLPFKQ